MSYWIYLCNEQTGESVQVEHFEDGGTSPLGGTDQAELNVTYNYREVFSLFDFNLRDLDKKRAYETLPKLEELASKLPNKPYRDYWAPTPGNAGAVVHRLLTWAKQYPDAAWSVN